MTFLVNGIAFTDINRAATLSSANAIGSTGAVQCIDAFQGTVSGYSSGGSGTELNVIDKFPFASNANATDVGDLTVPRTNAAGQSSSVSGYTSGGASPPLTPTNTNVIDKFPFASNANASDVGDLSVSRFATAGQSSREFGYTSGGRPDSAGSLNIIDKFPFASNANASDVGDLSGVRSYLAGHSSTVSGYVSGGYSPPAVNVNIINKFPFASNANATDVGDLTVVRNNVTGQSSYGFGYTSGGYTSPPATRYNTIDKFSFATDGNASDVGDLTQSRQGAAGQSSTVSGYTSGGDQPSGPPFKTNVIDKFPFATDGNATDVGDLTIIRDSNTGQQV